MFKVLKKFVQGQERKRSLLENAMGVVKRDHLLAQLQTDTAGGASSSAPVAAAPLPEIVETPATAPASTVPDVPAPEKPLRKRSRAKKPAKKPIPEPPLGAFEFMAAIDLELKGAATEAPAPLETPGLPPDFEAKLQRLGKLMNFDDC